MHALLGLVVLMQTQSTANLVSTAPVRQVTAASAATAPVLDGKDTDDVWRTARPITEFLQHRPNEGAPARFPTEARVAFDPQNLYVFVRAYDPAPDSIPRYLVRRDQDTPSDQITVFVDSYHDRRTGYEFIVNPVGVKMDLAVYNDGNEDIAWNGVWEVATLIDSLGWTAEFRIPLSQLRYSTSASTFGFSIWREIRRFNEQVSWPLWRVSQPGFVSQWGDLTGLSGLATPKRAELTPYLVTRNEPRFASSGIERNQALTVGGDLKYAISSNLILNATVNPDFGQVEADPGVLNLSAFETFFNERRPFFVEGKGLFSLPVNCTAVNDCSTGEGFFYSRRIGRAPSLAGRYGDASSPTATTILGAAKVTGRTAGGFSLGVLDAVTGREQSGHGETLEPATNYAVVRANQDLDGGNTSVGAMFSGVNRSMDRFTADFLHRSAYAGAVDARRRMGRFEVSGQFGLSRVEGTPEAILLTQTSSVHNFQRPDGANRVDSSRTSLTGTDLELHFAKVGGELTRFQTSYVRRSEGFEVNDLGFLRQADLQSWSTWFAFRFNRPNTVFKRLQWNMNWWQYWTIDGLSTERAFNTNTHTQFQNDWWLHAGGTIGQLGQTFCDRCARGGPALRQEPYLAPWAGIEGNNLWPVVPYMWVNYFRGDDGRSESLSLSPELDFKFSSRFTSALSLDYTWNHDDSQWFGNFTDLGGVTHYTFAHLDQKTMGITLRANYTFTPTASLQVYAQPFISKGTYSEVRELNQPRAARYEDRFQPYADPAVADDPGGFNFKQFRSNVVFRWEYRPGSTLFLVWSQGREAFAPREGARGFGHNLGDLFGQRADDVFLVKLSYWFDW